MFIPPFVGLVHLPRSGPIFNRNPWPEDFPLSFLRVYSVHPRLLDFFNERVFSVMDLISTIFQSSVISFDLGKISAIFPFLTGLILGNRQTHILARCDVND